MGKYSLKKFPQAYILDTCEIYMMGFTVVFHVPEVSGLIWHIYNMFSEHESLETEDAASGAQGLEHFISKALICPDIRLRIRYPVSIL